MGELLHNFGVDWKLLAAQVVNFAILFYLLKKFAYRPILEMLRKRREEIAKGLEMRAEAEKTLGEVEQIKETTAREAQEKALATVQEAEETAGKRKQEILHDAEARGEVLIAEAKQKAEKEAEKVEDRVMQEAEELVRQGVAQVLRQMPAEERDRELIRSALAAVKQSRSV